MIKEHDRVVLTKNLPEEKLEAGDIGSVTPEEKALLDRELEEYRRNPDAGSTWQEVEARIRKPSRP